MGYQATILGLKNFTNERANLNNIGFYFTTHCNAVLLTRKPEMPLSDAGCSKQCNKM